MTFRTVLNLPPSELKVSHQDRILLLGSCFSQNIGERLQKYKFNCISNPFGTIFNPVSISKLVGYVCRKEYITGEELILSQGRYVHPDFHSVLSDVDAIDALEKINSTIDAIHEYLKYCSHIYFTLGTAIAYKMKSSGQIVANCHKLPSILFEKVDISIEEGKTAIFEMISLIMNLNPNVEIIFTVSPVRHIKDGIIENTKSKARLICMIEEVTNSHPAITYFPSYDIMMDDLRDYRFYEADMIHPNEVAIDYIWEKYSGHYFTPETIELNKQLNKIFLASQHRPFNPESDLHQNFVRQTMADIEAIRQKNSNLNFERELDLLKSKR